MADNTGNSNVAEAAAPAPAVNAEPTMWTDIFNQVSRFAMVYFFISQVLKPLLNTDSPNTLSKTNVQLPILDDTVYTIDAPIYKDSNPLASMMGGESSKIPVFAMKDSLGRPLPPHTNLYRSNDTFNLQVYITPDSILDAQHKDLMPVLSKTNVLFDWRKGGEEVIELDINITASESLQTNQSSLYAHIYFTLSSLDNDTSLPPFHPDYINDKRFSKVVELVVFKKRPKKDNKKKLMESSSSSPSSTPPVNDTSITGSTDNETTDITLIPCWRPSLVISLVLGTYVTS
jgi:hypothetical protein